MSIETIIKLVSLVVAALALAITAYSTWQNARLSRRNRQVTIAMQLNKDFYHDMQFSLSRLDMWGHLDRLPDEDHHFTKITAWALNDRTAPLKREQIAA